MNHLQLDPESAVGQRFKELSQDDRVSDFYLTPNEPLAYKLNGELIYDGLVYQREVPEQLDPGCHDSAIDLHGRRFRVSQMVTKGRLRWVLRLLPNVIPTPESIKVPASSLKAFLEAKNGLFLICGATGSGKSTTIASMVLHRAKRRREHIISFEDPIEFVYPDNLPSLVSQREMGSDELDFGNALRAALRQAPDVIIIGEIRDGETAEIALQAAETGHVVVATLHTSSAAQTVQRFLKLIPSERLDSSQASLADSLRLILSRVSAVPFTRCSCNTMGWSILSAVAISRNSMPSSKRDFEGECTISRKVRRSVRTRGSLARPRSPLPASAGKRWRAISPCSRRWMSKCFSTSKQC